MKYARLIFAIVSTTNIPNSLPHASEEASKQKYQGGHFSTPITPIQGSILHAGSHPKVPRRFDWDLLIADSFEFSDLDGFIFDYGSNANEFGFTGEFNPAARYTTSIFDMAGGRQSVRLTVEAITPVPLPASALLLLGGLAGLGALSRRRRRAST